MCPELLSSWWPAEILMEALVADQVMPKSQFGLDSQDASADLDWMIAQQPCHNRS